jgi:hypothetical protein
LERQYDFPRWISAFLEAGERCEMDDGYQGSAPLYAKCPGVIETNLDKAEMQQRVWCMPTWIKNSLKVTNLEF